MAVRIRSGRRLTRVALAAAVLVVSGCASVSPPPPPPPAPAVAQVPLERLSGRFAMTDTEVVPEERRSGASGLFVVERNARGLMLELSSPLGQVIARASHPPGGPAELVTQNGQRLTGDSLDEVFQQAIGIRVPAERLPDWLDGRFAEILERSDDGRRLRARDDGWQIERRNNRWDLVLDQGTRRIEVRLIADAH